MKWTGGHRARCASGSRGLSLVEAVISVLIVGVMLSAVLNTVGSMSVGRVVMSDRAHGLALAEDLVGEITRQAYEEPTLPPGSFGRSASEDATGNRTLFDDVDDYDTWIGNPPEDRGGSAIPGADVFKRSVRVDWVDRNNLTSTSLTPTGVKRIIVTVTRAGRNVASLTAFRSVSWVDPALVRGGGG